MADGQTPANAVWIREDKIVAVGGGEVRDAALSQNCEVLDFGSRAILPGFVDPHTHLAAYLRARATMADCRVPPCRSIDDVLQQLSEACRSPDGNGWVLGQGSLYLDLKLAEGRLPTRAELDTVSRTIPIALCAGGHISVLNSRALERLEPRLLDNASPGAHVDWENGTIRELDHLLPVPPLDGAALRSVLANGVRDLCTANGLTAVGEMSETEEAIYAVDDLIRLDRMPLRWSVYLFAPITLPLEEAYDWRATNQLAAPEERLRIQGIKLMVDGGFSAATAATVTPYASGHRVAGYENGKLDLSYEQLIDVIGRARGTDMQLAFHTNGEVAQKLVCDATIAAHSGGTPVRLEHAGNYVTSPATVEAWRASGILPVPQPRFLLDLGAYFPDYLGRPGETGRWPLKSLLADGWRLSASSDMWPGAYDEAIRPLYTVWAAVKRQPDGHEAIEQDEAVTVTEALRMCTSYAAEANGDGHLRGTLEAGKVADIVILESDPRDLPVDAIRGLQVDFVYTDGKVVHSREGAAPPGSIADTESATN